MRETLVDVLVDDVGLVQHQVAIDQHRHAVVGIDHGDVFRLVVEIDIDHLKIHAFFKEHDPAAVAERVRRTGIQIHHDSNSSMNAERRMPKGIRRQ